ncbi:MAG: hypothetical protein B6D64_13045 [Bacteroidetes bacterium 4484_276]|nr:MAG: hypothetical protein B6D64_13045 [Bacteroidetes bacterium 4484_276]OYT13158.1 MAG: hypothetical protein B6I19_06520 [Bacteroidetes bacterium 4572_114]
MKKKLIIILCISYGVIHAQTTFNLLYKIPETYDTPGKIIEDNNNYLVLFTSNTIPQQKVSSHILTISTDGNIIDIVDFTSQDTSFLFGEIITRQNGYILFGSYRTENELYSNMLIYYLNENFEITDKKILKIGDGYEFASGFQAIQMQDGSYSILFSAYHTDRLLDICLYHISEYGDSLNYRQVEIPYSQYCFGFLDRKDQPGFYVFSVGYYDLPVEWPVGKKLVFDQDFNLENIDSIPQDLFGQYSTKWISDTSYIISGGTNTPGEIRGIKIMENTVTNQVIKANSYGLDYDTLSKPAVNRSFDFQGTNEIYFSGMANLYPPEWPWQQDPSWVMINKVDSEFDIIWQKFIGGDSFYLVWDTQMSSDNCYLLACSKYDYEPGNYDHDLLIIKIDSNGLITGIEDQPTPIELHDAIVYPNPGSSYLKIQSGPQINGAVFEMFDMAGKAVAREILNGRLMEINTGRLPTGTYTYRILWQNRLVGSGKWVKR